MAHIGRHPKLALELIDARGFQAVKRLQCDILARFDTRIAEPRRLLAEFGQAPTSNGAPPSSAPPRSGQSAVAMVGRVAELESPLAAYEASVMAREPVVVMLEERAASARPLF